MIGAAVTAAMVAALFAVCEFSGQVVDKNDIITGATTSKLMHSMPVVVQQLLKWLEVDRTAASMYASVAKMQGYL
jgi:hypothetical protein